MNLELLFTFNKLIDSWKRAEKFFADDTISIQDKTNKTNDIISLHKKINSCIDEIEKSGYKLNENEILNGFEILRHIIR